MQAIRNPFDFLFFSILLFLIWGDLDALIPAESAGERKVVFVSEGATGTGTSWDDAMGNLQTAIDLPFEGFEGIDIWLSEGIYHPDTTDLVDYRLSAIVLRNGVRIFGGFNGTETNLEQRDPTSHISRLSGDFMRTENKADNTYRMIFCINLDSTSVLDGVIVSDGYSGNGSGNRNGAGFYMAESSNVFRDVIFENNHSAMNGGAFYMDRSAPLFERVTFRNCISEGFGGAGYFAESEPEFISCQAINNKAGNNWHGGAFFLFKSDVVFINCIMANNAADHGEGGALYCNDSSPLILNCLLVNNYARSDAGAIYCQYSTSSPKIINSILWANFDYDGLNHIWGGFHGETNAEILHSVVQGGNLTGIPENRYIGNLETLPRFENPENVTGNSSEAINADWTLCISSPCINAGRPHPALTDLDLGKNPRIFGDTVDIGPYEFQGNYQGPKDTLVIYVKPDGNGEGKSWEDAIGNLQEALDVPLDTFLQKEIWISEGLYIAGPESLNISWNTNLVGGFDTLMTYREERNPSSQKCIISGDLGNDDNITNNTSVIFSAYNIGSIEIDGLVLEETHEGGAIFSRFSQIDLDNCIFKNNRNGTAGGALFLEGSRINITRCTFHNNSSHTSGAVYATGSELYFENCSFINGTGEAGALALLDCESTLWNCLIANNMGNDYGAMLLIGGSCSILNSSLLFNDSEYDNVAGIYCASDLSVRNSILWGNYIPGNEVFHLDIRETGNAYISHSAVQSGNTFGLDDSMYIQNSSLYPSFLNPITKPGPISGAYVADWSLSINSPLIDKGTISGLDGMVPKTDLAGMPRISNDSIDMGAYEYAWAPSFLRNEKIDKIYEGKEVLVIPNPGPGPFRFQIPFYSQDFYLTVYDSRGRLIMDEHIDELSDLELKLEGPSGIYYVKIQNANGQTGYAKIVKVD